MIGTEPPVPAQIGLAVALVLIILWQMVSFALSERRTGRGSPGDWVFPGLLVAVCLIFATRMLVGGLA